MPPELQIISHKKMPQITSMTFEKRVTNLGKEKVSIWCSYYIRFNVTVRLYYKELILVALNFIFTNSFTYLCASKFREQVIVARISLKNSNIFEGFLFYNSHSKIPPIYILISTHLMFCDI